MTAMTFSPRPRATRRLRIAAATLAVWALAAAAAAQEPRIEPVESYLNAITTLDTRFLQLNPDGTRATGTFQLKRPHFARIAYDDPPTLLVARGQRYRLWDAEIGQVFDGVVSATPAGVLLRPEISLGEAVEVVELRRRDGRLLLTLATVDEPGAGLLTLAFDEDPLALARWRVKDAQGYVTHVILLEPAFGVELDDALFTIDDIGSFGRDRGSPDR